MKLSVGFGERDEAFQRVRLPLLAADWSALLQGPEAVRVLPDQCAPTTHEVFRADAKAKPDQPLSCPIAKHDESLPLAPIRADLIETLKEHHGVVIAACTGSGKSTAAPRWIAEKLGYIFKTPGRDGLVICSVPRVVQSLRCAEYTAKLLRCDVGQNVGYVNSRSSQRGPDTRILFVTHGTLELMVLHNQIPDFSVVMLDETHENQACISPILLQLREQLQAGKPLKIVAMSATMDTELFSQYLGGIPVLDPAPASGGTQTEKRGSPSIERIITQANRGRPQRIHYVQPCETIEEDIVTAVKKGGTPIVFVAGKSDIERVITDVEQLAPDISCLPFHAQLSPEQVAEVFKPLAGKRAIIATNVGGTGLTYPEDVDTVIGTPEVRRMVVGVEGEPLLEYDQITVAEVVQLLGRIGRRGRDGYAVLRLSSRTGSKGSWMGDSIPPEIQSISLARMMLQHIAVGRDLYRDNQSFIWQASQAQLATAERLLKTMELVNKNGITTLGQSCAALMVDPHLAKFLVLSKRLAERTERPNILLNAIDVVAVIEAEGVIERGSDVGKLVTRPIRSQPFAEAEVFRWALTKSAVDRALSGVIIESQFVRARENQRLLRKRLMMTTDEKIQACSDTADLGKLQECFWSALKPWLYRRVSISSGSSADQQVYKPLSDTSGSGGLRILPRDSLVSNASPYLVGLPLSIEVRDVSETRRALLSKINAAPDTLPLVTHASAVDEWWVRQVLTRREKRDFGSAKRPARNNYSHRQPPRTYR